ncbi:uncharacterized protein C2orf81 homolog isoform X4 [Crotalus tigris]|uniref:uncharacterized protein C2orf81 homolog isoform X4 n=1 Tax=Crotalus tigris TaxID=88082 RepID=UPI00192F6412|nr:uncharacterized protein C2orf81 homolog isoform X4 [Crotalus tigris]XP_039189772.1 uncharacterized protein C2orf81 homolog isoform X4 [Crotalus tigris]
METAALLSHPLWFICSLALLALLWVRGRKSWRPEACPVDLSGKTAIVTGASSGIGKAVALDLARRNARTILACRCRDKGQAAVEEIRKATGNPQVQLRLLDISSMASVRDFARKFLEEGSQLHILVNNAGVTGLPFAITAEGLELTFATNVLGPFLLTNLLLGTMVASAPARIVNVSSFRHFCVRKVDLKWLTGEELPKNASHAYDCTKLMNVAFTIKLAQRLQGTGVLANVLSPGVVRTEILRNYGRASRLLYRLCSPFMRSPQKGATSTLYCAVAPEVEGISGKYFDSNCTLVLPQDLAQDPGLGQRLWDALEKATGLKTEGSHQAVSGPLGRER